MRERLWGACALVLIGSGGCGAASVAPTAMPRDEATAAPSPPWALHAIPRPSSSRGITAGVPLDDGWLVAAGGLRLSVSGGEVARALDTTGTRIVAIARTSAWLFVTEEGELFRASTPLGALELVGSLEGTLGAVASVGPRVALLDEDGRLHVGDETGLVHVRTELPVVAAAFATRSLGAAIDVEGSVQLTRDGGASWTPAPLDPQAGTPMSVEASGEVLSLHASRAGRLRLTAEGAWAPETDAGPRASVPEVPRAVRALVDDETTRSPDRVISGLSADGRVLVARGGAYVVMPGGTELGAPPDAYCDAASFQGRGVVLRCDEGLFRSEDGGPFVRIARGLAPETVRLDPESDLIAAPGPCPRADAGGEGGYEESEGGYEDEGYEEDEGADDRGADDEGEDDKAGKQDDDAPVHDALCVLGRAGARTVPVSDLVAVAGFSRGRVVVRRAPTGRASTVEVLDLATGALAPLALPAGLAPREVGTASDGTVWTVGEGPRVAVGTTTTGLVEVSLPEALSHAVVRVVFVDRQHVVAAGRRASTGATFDHVFLSSDGGGHFDELPAAPGRALELARCDGASCGLGAHVWAPEGRWPLPVGAQHGWSGAPGQARRGLETPSLLTTHLRCDVPIRWSGRPTPPLLPEVTSARTLLADGWISIAGPASTPWTEGPLAARFGGLERGAAFAAEAGRGTVAPVPSFDPGETSSVSVRLVAATRGVALLERRRRSQRHLRVDWVAVTAGAPPRWIDDLGGERPLLVGRELRGTLALPDGRLALRIGGMRGVATPRQTDVVVVLGPDGSESVHVLESGDVDTARALAVHGDGRVGIVVVRGHDARFVPIDGSRSVALARPAEHVGRVCGDDERGVVLVSGPLLARDAPSPVVELHHASGQVLDGTSLIELFADGSACVRGARATGAIPSSGEEATPSSTERAVAGLVVDARGGALVGTLASPAGPVRSFACEVGPRRQHTTGPLLAAMGPLADGSTGIFLAYGAGVPVRVAGRLVGDTWQTRAATAPSYVGERGVLRAGAAEPRIDVAARTSHGHTLDGDELASSELAHVGAGPSEVVLVAGDAGSAPLVVRDATGASRPIDTGGHAPRGARLASRGAGLAAGVVLFAGPNERGCTVRGIEIGPTETRLRGRVDVDRGCASLELALDAPTGHVVVVFERPREASADAARAAPTLEVWELGADRARRLGAPIVTSSWDGAPRALAVSVAPGPRVAFSDSAGSESPPHVRVVELRGRDWHDVAPPWEHAGVAAASFDGDRALVVASDGFAEPTAEEERGLLATPRAARLEAGTWTPLSFATVVDPSPLGGAGTSP